jgi:hypothetical protein
VTGPPLGKRGLFDSHGDHLAKLLRVGVAVSGDGVDDGGFEEFAVAVGGDGDRAVLLARVLPAIDDFASHGALLLKAPTK